MNRGVEIRELKKNFALTRWTGFSRTVSESRCRGWDQHGSPGGSGRRFHRAQRRRKIHNDQNAYRNSASDIRKRLPCWDSLRGGIGASLRIALERCSVSGRSSGITCRQATRLSFLSRIYKLERSEFIRTRNVLIERFNLGPFMDTPGAEALARPAHAR